MEHTRTYDTREVTYGGAQGFSKRTPQEGAMVDAWKAAVRDNFTMDARVVLEAFGKV
ncbi:hypothetical protein HPP92_014574 [Vanilla planifolia]|uniref:Uncharacterized protein n=1 Tax=Vanilla planifolia TaxID=51239 RepID=A0A835QUQ4_VANPL|nr:hypothetical protein HPP92_014574 [Vanilla planifolia]